MKTYVDEKSYEAAREMGNKIINFINECDPEMKFTNAQMMIVASIVAASVISTAPEGEKEEAALTLLTALTSAGIAAIRRADAGVH